MLVVPWQLLQHRHYGHFVAILPSHLQYFAKLKLLAI